MTNGTHRDNEPGLFDEPAAPAPLPNYPQLRLTTTVRHEASGFVFQVEFNDTPISAVVEVLQKRGCVPATASAARASGPALDGDPPVCQNKNCTNHGRPLSQGQFGWRCNGKDAVAGNAKGYCRFTG